MLVKVEITKDGFMLGRTKIPVGDTINVAPPIARYIERNNEGKIVGEVKPVVKKKAVKKATYKTRDMKAE